MTTENDKRQAFRAGMIAMLKEAAHALDVPIRSPWDGKDEKLMERNFQQYLRDTA